MQQNLQRQERKDLRKKALTERVQEQQKHTEQLYVMFELCKAQNALANTKAGKEAKKMIQTLINKINLERVDDKAYIKLFELAFGTKERNERAKKLMKVLGWKKGPTAHMAAMQPKWRRNLFVQAMRAKQRKEREA